MYLSIIIPVYNKTEYLEGCLKSVLGQTVDDLEAICIDDGSTDGSAEIVERFAEKDKRIWLIRQPNLGAGAARNVGVKAAKGEYIAFLDADDYYPFNDTLAKLYERAVAKNADVCGGSFLTYNGTFANRHFDGVMSGNTFTQEGFVDFRDYQFDYGFYRFIYRREFLLRHRLFFPDYRRYQDPPFMLRAFAAAGRFYAIPDITYSYRVSERPVNWTTEKVLDLLCGIEDNLIFSAEKGYERVHALNYYRLCNDFCSAVVGTALRQDGEGKILKRLIEVQSAVNTDMIQASGLFTAEERKLSKPLSELIERLSAQNVKLKSEGWFIDKKLFRAYTWPVRIVGKVLKKLRRRRHGRVYFKRFARRAV